ncbi:oligopeptide-binding protein AppA [Clostridiales bacterium]|nr:oligopeptide-binding protein AppA [Clostridiales bacterium]
MKQFFTTDGDFIKRKYLSVIFCIILLVTGCSKKSSANTQSEVASQGVSIDKQINTTDVITISMSMTKTLNPLINSDESVDRALSLLYEKLINIGADGKAEPNIAQSWEFNEDGSVINIFLRNDVFFSDGTRLTAYDVAYSLRTIDNAEDSYYKNCLKNIKTWTVTGDNSLTVTFYESTGRNIYYLAVPIISSVFYGGDYAELDDKSDSALGNGLYRFESYKKPDRLTLLSSLNCFKGTAGISRADIIMTKDIETDINLFSQGITDLLAANDTEASEAKSGVGVVATEYTTGEYDFIGFNFNNGILSDRNVRQAIAYAVNKEEIIEGIYLGNAEEAYSPIKSTSWLYEPLVYGYDYDTSVANMLLEQSGWRYRSGSDEVRQSGDGNPSELSLRLLVNGENNERKQVGVKLAETLRGLGFNINLEIENFEVYKEKLDSGSFDIFIGGWQLSPVEDFSFMFGSEKLNGKGNLISYNSAKMDEYLEACKSAVNDEDMKEAYSGLQKYISQELPYISLVFRQSKVYAGTRIEGTLSPSQNDVFDGIENIMIKK